MKTERKNRRRPAFARSLQRMKYCAAGASCLAAACLAAACGDDEEDGGGTTGENATDVMPPVAGAGIRFPVAAIYDGGSRSPSAAFSYENGRMTGAYGEDGIRYVFGESPLTVKGKWDGNVGQEESFKDIRLNPMGFVTSCDYEVRVRNQGEEHVALARSSIEIEYDSEGHMVRVTDRYSGTDGGNPSGTYEYHEELTWQGGNLTSIRGYEGDDMTYEAAYTYSEDRYPNPGVWNFFSPDGADGGGDFLPVAFRYAGLLGKPTKDIPLTCTEKDGISYAHAVKDVDYNGDGSVAGISSSHVHGEDGRISNDSVRFAYGNASGISYEPAAGYGPVEKSVADGSRRGRRGLHKRMAERTAQGKNAR